MKMQTSIVNMHFRSDHSVCGGEQTLSVDVWGENLLKRRKPGECKSHGRRASGVRKAKAFVIPFELSRLLAASSAACPCANAENEGQTWELSVAQPALGQPVYTSKDLGDAVMLYLIESF